MTDNAQGLLFENQTGPVVVCRDGGRRPPIEWQADCFSASLLMPRSMVFSAWAARGYEKVASARLGGRRSDAVRNMAEQFQVSNEAMANRLEKLGLLMAPVTEDLFRAFHGQ